MRKNKLALIFGITGQDGSYLAELLLKKKYIVHGVKRRSSSINTARIDHIYQEPQSKNQKFFLHYGDMTDATSIFNLINDIRPDEIYNLAAQSNVALSFIQPHYTFQVNALGTLAILEAIKTLKLNTKTKLYHAATSEMFGNSNKKSLSENSGFYPVSPYGSSKLAAHNLILNYRNSYNIFGVSGILFNHESPRRGETFVTKKIIRSLCEIKNNKKDCLYLGNIYSKRDWGHAKDYVEMQWKMLQKKIPNDYVIATGKSYSIKEFINLTLKQLNMKSEWLGKDLKEVCIYNNKPIIRISKKYFRPNELHILLGNSSLAKKELAWEPRYDINQLIKEMIAHELNNN